MKYEFPVEHISNNLIFNSNGEVWAYFKINGFNYDFANRNEKDAYFDRQVTGLQNEAYDFHYLSVPNPTNTEEIIKRTIEQIEFKDYVLKENGKTLLKKIMKQLTSLRETSESSEYFDFVGVQLKTDKRKNPEGNAGLNVISTIKNFLQGLNSPIYQAVGLKVGDILESEVETYRSQSKLLEATLSNMFSSKVQACSFGELLRIIELNFSTRTNNSDIKLREEFNVGISVEGTTEDGKKHKAIRKDTKHFVAIQDMNIDEINPSILEMSRINEKNENERMFIQHLIVSEMPDVSVFPNNEWLYHLKTYMPFPFTCSIRSNRVPNSQVLKRLGNQKLEIVDQREEAQKANVRVDLNVDVSEKGTFELENYFTRTGYPAFETSIIFRVTANTEEQLKSRSDVLRDHLTRFGIKTQIPYGEQLSLFTEMIAGGIKKLKEYQCLVAPPVLAGIMFGATTNIGDNRGFYIGDTKDSNKPVFIQPDLAAKSFDGLQTVVSSLAILVAGMTGRGKSFFMNLLTYLSVLTGAKALIIDPKGDRKDWSDGLPLIPKEFIRVWTLGSDSNDAGALDPFRTSINIEEGKAIAKDILAFLTRTSIQNYAYGELTNAVEYAAIHDDPCIEVVMNYLIERKETQRSNISEKAYEELENFVQTLESLSKDKLSKLLFGKVGQNYNTLSHELPLQVLMIENLTLPSEKEVEAQQLRPVHFISEAILISITAWTKEYMIKGDKKVYKIILQDEANVIKRNPIGEQLIDTINRQGRSFNTSLLQGAQNATDHKDNVSHIGMKFSFGLRYKKEAIEMLDFLNLPQTEENINRLMTLPKGEALFQDIYGRSAIVYINPVFEEIYKAFDTSTATEEEKAFEKQHA